MDCLNKAWTDHAVELRSWLRNRLDHKQDVDDLMQDLFMKALRQGNKFCAVSNSRAWLFQVARYALIDRVRVSKDMVNLPDDLPDLGESVDTVDNLTACLPRVLSELDEIDRMAILLCDLQGLPHADYARRVNISLSAAKSRLFRARLRLKTHMTQACQIQFDEHGGVGDFVPRPGGTGSVQFLIQVIDLKYHKSHGNKVVDLKKTML